MTSKLYLMRHAQAESFGPSGDMSRGLTDLGRDQAHHAGELLAAAGIQLAMVSAAQRARETFAAMALSDPEGRPVRAEYMKALYDASPATLLQRIGETPDEVSALLVLAHAPGIPSLAANLTWAASHREADLMQCAFPAATLVAFDVDGPWSQLTDFDPYDSTDAAHPRVSPVRPADLPTG